MINKIKIEGLDNLDKGFASLTAPELAKIYRQINRDAGRTLIVNPAKSIVSDFSKETRKGLKIVNSKYSKTDVLAGATGDFYKGWWAEGGTKERITKSGRNTGKINPRNRLKPFIEGQLNSISSFSADKTLKAIERQLDRNLKKY